MENFLTIRCELPAELVDELPMILDSRGALGIEIGETSGQRTVVSVFFRGDDATGADTVRQLLTEHGAKGTELFGMEGEDWLAVYREASRPFEVGHTWWIDPSPDRPSVVPAGRRRLFIEPQMAFGSGSHESTRGILRELEKIDVEGCTVLDVGTGSGILALAAEQLDAATVVGLDIDEVAILVAAETARRQDRAPKVRFVLGSVDCLGRVEFDIVLCNMIVSNFLPLLDDLKRVTAANGSIVLSGLLVAEVDPVSRKLAGIGLEIASREDIGEWSCLVVREPSRR
jgi:ribosomal protein L11 methyltransferase